MTPASFLDHPWIPPLGWALVQFLWQGTLIAVLFAAARGVLGRWLQARSRYVLACLTLGMLVAAPILTCIAAPDVSMGSPISSWPLASSEAWNTVMPWLVAGWLAGVAGFSLRLAGGWFITRRLRGTGVRPAPAEWQETLESLVERLGVARPVRLLVSAYVEVPTVIGWLRPVVLVPIGALTGLPATYVTALLAHELAHVRRYDYLVNLLQRLVETLLFYHPAVWWVSNQVRIEREMCCDDLAVVAHGDALSYARALTELESCRRVARGPALAADGMPLLDRVRRLLGHRPSTGRMLPTPAAAIAMVMLCVAGIAAVAAHGATPEPPARHIAAVPGPQVLRPAPDTRALIAAVLQGPVGPSSAAPADRPSAPIRGAGGRISAETLSATAQPGERAAAIRGRVRRSDTNASLRNVSIRLRARGVGNLPTATTDDTGRFELTGLPPAEYRLIAFKGGFVMTEEDRGGAREPNQIAGREIALANGEQLDDLDVLLVPGAIIAGQVVDEAGEPLAGAVVHARAQQPHDGRMWPHPSAAASDITDDRGQFRLFGLAPGGYFVSAAAVGSPLLNLYAPSPTGLKPTFYPGTLVPTEAQVFFVEAGQEIGGLSFGLAPAPAGISGIAAARPSGASGRAARPRSAPIPGLRRSFPNARPAHRAWIPEDRPVNEEG